MNGFHVFHELLPTFRIIKKVQADDLTTDHIYYLHFCYQQRKH